MHELADIDQMPLFTHENAATLGKQGALARWSKPRPEPTPAIPAPIPLPIAEPDNSFAGRRLMRVREQLERLDRLASEEDDPKQLKALADATTRLSEQERLLAGRPLPGSRRPSADPKNPKSNWWIEMQPSAPALPAPCLTTAPAPTTMPNALCAPPAAPSAPDRLPGDVTP